MARVPDSIPGRGLNLFRVYRPARSVRLDQRTHRRRSPNPRRIKPRPHPRRNPGPSRPRRVGQHRSAHERTQLRVRLALATVPLCGPKRAINQSHPPCPKQRSVFPRRPTLALKGPGNRSQAIGGPCSVSSLRLPWLPLPPSRQSTDAAAALLTYGVRSTVAQYLDDPLISRVSFLSFFPVCFLNAASRPSRAAPRAGQHTRQRSLRQDSDPM